jgi:hypothetical protein
MTTASPHEQWIADLREYCRSLNISTDDLYRIVTDLKVAPMIRGKAFEFSTYARLKRILPGDVWLVTKPIMNAQSSLHDMDVLVTHIPTETHITVECKLAGKGKFRVAKRAQGGNIQKGDYTIAVKCMRSRTTKSPDKVASMAKQLKVTPEAFLAHSDQYRASHFNIVATSIGNAFYETIEDEDGNMAYKFQPTEAGLEFIKSLNPPSETEGGLQEFVYNKVYLIRSDQLAVSKASGVICGKKSCKKLETVRTCGFIPNYPLINFGKVDEQPDELVPQPTNGWIE